MKRYGISTVQKPLADWTESEVSEEARGIVTLARESAEEWGQTIDEGSWRVSVEPLYGGQVIQRPHLGGGTWTMVTPQAWGVVVRWEVA